VETLRALFGASNSSRWPFLLVSLVTLVSYVGFWSLPFKALHKRAVASLVAELVFGSIAAIDCVLLSATFAGLSAFAHLPSVALAIVTPVVLPMQGAAAALTLLSGFSVLLSQLMRLRFSLGSSTALTLLTNVRAAEQRAQGRLLSTDELLDSLEKLSWTPEATQRALQTARCGSETADQFARFRMAQFLKRTGASRHTRHYVRVSCEFL
jgi:hypothetical protein